MKKRGFLLTAVLVLAMFLSACSGGTPPITAPKEAPQLDRGELNESAAGQAPNGGMVDVPGAEPAPAPNLEGTQGAYQRTDVKLILRASLTLQTTDFTAATAALEALVGQLGGYYESAQEQGGGYYDSNAARYGSYVVRIPKESYRSFLGATDGIGYEVSRTERSEDVGEVYFDTEARLKTQQVKQERLQSLLEKAATMEDIIDLENALAEVEYQIEQLTGTLRQYDSLVSYATVSIELDEVVKLDEEPTQTDSLGTRMSKAFSHGMANFSSMLSSLAVWIAYHFMGVLVCVGVALVLVVILRRKRHHWLASISKQPPTTPQEEKSNDTPEDS